MTTPADPPSRWLDDFHAGEVFEFGDEAVTAEEIVAFASRFDPQPFHLDAAAGARTHFGGLVASGWHTASLMMRMLVQHFIPRASSLGSPGIDELRWLRPVRPGDRLRARLTVIEVKPSRSKPDRGVLHQRTEVLNQHGETVMTCLGMGMYLRAPQR
ncbi:MAG: MaoC family dehydratase [Rubrivivax sp.]|nr:MaoC family dehydratase [Rubrivivax sp.]